MALIGPVPTEGALRAEGGKQRLVYEAEVVFTVNTGPPTRLLRPLLDKVLTRVARWLRRTPMVLT